MAQPKDPNNVEVITTSFTKGLNKDSDPTFITDGMWTHARNTVNNTAEGDVGTLSNESSNFLCATAGSTMPALGIYGTTKRYIIGGIHLYSDKWIIFTVGHNQIGVPILSEIGLLEEERCIYRPIVQDACLKFDKRFLISGSSREKEDCSWQVYWADGLNPDRYLNVGDPQLWPEIGVYNFIGVYGTPTQNLYADALGNTQLWPGVQWYQLCKDLTTNIEQVTPDVWPVNTPPLPIDCISCRDIGELNCPNIRLARLMETPCLKLELGPLGGTLQNGTYFVTIAYSIKGQRVTDYFSPSNTQPIWSRDDVQGALSISVEADSVNFDEFILVVVQNVNQGTVAKQIGIYKTTTKKIELDRIKEDLATVPLEQLPLQTPVYETSNQISDVNNYLLRVGPRSRFDFNYQPLANLIRSKWVSVEYPSDYYVNGGNKGSYYRDEVYSFFIRWVYNTGDKSSSYHIPGRPPQYYSYTNPNFPYTVTSEFETTDTINDKNTLDNTDQLFEIYNTASVGTIPGTLDLNTDDGGTVIATGNMGYWESTELYPNDRPDIWNPSDHCWTGPLGQSGDFDLCGKPIRHHKFPDNGLLSSVGDPVALHYAPNIGTNSANTLKIRIMGVRFENIMIPVDNEGIPIEGVVGFEILRGTREGNRTILAKGMINNFRTFQLKDAPLGVNGISLTQGLYANYPFNTITPVQSATIPQGIYSDPFIKSNLFQTVPKDIVSIHSPDLMFTTPYLSATELKIYGELAGYSSQQFKYPDNHPEFKLLSDIIVPLMVLAGLVETTIGMLGRRTYNQPSIEDTLQQLVPTAVTNPLQVAALGALGTPAVGIIPGGPIGEYNQFVDKYYSSGDAFTDIFVALGIGGYQLTQANIYQDTLIAALNSTAAATGIIPVSRTGTIELPDYAYLPFPLSTLGGINAFSNYFSQGADLAVRAIYTFSQYDQYALQIIGHGFYDRWRSTSISQIRRFKTQDSFYIRDNIQEMRSYQLNNNPGQFTSYTINNLQRGDTAVIRTLSGPYANIAYPTGESTGPYYITGPYQDQSLITMSGFTGNSNGTGNTTTSSTSLSNPTWTDIDTPFALPISSHYAALKFRIRNQYGQLESIKQIAITPCEQKLSNYVINSFVNGWPCPADGIQYTLQALNTNTFFGGDIFINRYTEKNTMLYFYNWLYEQPDGFEYNYYLYSMIPRARFWANTKQYDVQDLATIINWTNPTIPGTGPLPTDFYRLDNENYKFSNNSGNYPGFFRAKRSYFYLANSAVRDFFVESEVLVDFRKDGELEYEKHYDPYRYTNLPAMFDMNPQVITRGNIWRYDYSYSLTKLFSQYFSAGNLQNRYYNPIIAKLCYTYLPDRIIYSLPQQVESSKDSWFIYLVNNYKDFKSQISGVKSINKSGIIITFKNDSPQMFQGVDTLETEIGTKITIGDGGLFSQPAQSVSNADTPYEYGSSQNRLSVIGSPAGIYYISQNQGKIFLYGGEGLKEISQAGLKWWFTLFLPYKLTEDFPDYPYQDNPVAGIGCQTMYDNENSIVYFSKKDYKLKPEFEGTNSIVYIPLITTGKKKGQGDYFTNINFPNTIFLLGDPLIFDNASWTVSFDPKNQFWISFHDWHPDLTFPTKKTFLTTKENGLWKHNYLCDNFCNFYGTVYPFELELPVITGQTVTTLKSIEYMLECYRRQSNNCIDQFHVLDYNFDRLVIYNSEQVSGYLNLNIFPKNNITLSLDYPKLATNNNSFDILFSKEENKYRINQFWDTTNDRSEFPINSNYPPTGQLIPGTTVLLGNYADRLIWNTEANGYIKALNPLNLDYGKSETQRKKFRHYLNFINFSKADSTDTNMIVKLTNTKNQISHR